MRRLSLKERLGKIINHYRKRHRLSQKDLGYQLSYSQSIISRLEKGYDVIQLSVYVDVYRQLNLFFDANDVVVNEFNGLIDEAYQATLFLDPIALKKVLGEMDQRLPNVLFYYDYLVFESYDSFYSGQDKGFIEDLDQVRGLESMLHPKSGELFYYLDTVYHLSTQALDKVKPERFMNIPKHTSSIHRYILGIYDHYANQHSKSLTHLLVASSAFLAESNTRRYGRSEIYINKALMRDNDYFNSKLRLASALKDNPDFLHKDMATLLFQLGYNEYYLNDYSSAYRVFTGIAYDQFIYSHFLPYYLYKCEVKLGMIKAAEKVERAEEDNYLFWLFQRQQEEHKEADYYQTIETHVLPKVQHYSEIKEIQLYSIELLDHYYKKKQYKKFKTLASLLNKYYQMY